MSASSDLVISSVRAQPMPIEASNFPWHNGEKNQPIEITPHRLELEGGAKLLYASGISFNNTIEKIADKVPEDESDRLQAMMFRGLSSILNGEPVKHIGKLEGSTKLTGSDFFIASGTLNTAPSFVFAIQSSPTEQKTPPLVVRAGIATEKERPRLLKVM